MNQKLLEQQLSRPPVKHNIVAAASVITLAESNVSSDLISSAPSKCQIYSGQMHINASNKKLQ